MLCIVSCFQADVITCVRPAARYRDVLHTFSCRRVCGRFAAHLGAMVGLLCCMRLSSRSSCHAHSCPSANRSCYSRKPGRRWWCLLLLLLLLLWWVCRLAGAGDWLALDWLLKLDRLRLLRTRECLGRLLADLLPREPQHGAGQRRHS